MNKPSKTAVIIGAGPAGLTAAYELLDKTDYVPIVYEMSGDVGGISKTVAYKGNRMDIGGHRFFSKSDRVMQWWQNILPIQGAPARDDRLLGRTLPWSHECTFRPLKCSEIVKQSPPDPEKEDRVLLIRNRLSRIFYLRRFFEYPIALNLETLANLGLVRVMRIGLSYAKVRIAPIRPEKSLEDFFINRFGRELYRTFFKDYTEKVWGVPCSAIRPEWGVQRVKGLSMAEALRHALKRRVPDPSIAQKDTETSLIQRFLYPKFGPGQMWQEVARLVRENGGQVLLNHRVIALRHRKRRITAAAVRDEATGTVRLQEGDCFFSSMPVKELIQCLGEGVPREVVRVAQGLQYRDFITVGLLLKRLKIPNETKIKTLNGIVPDNWIYIQENDVRLGRIQIFNNWSPYLVRDPDTVWVGLEYFCNEGDALWRQRDEALIRFAMDELCKIGFADPRDMLDGTVLRMPKAYPAYFGTYAQFRVIREFVDRFENLFLIGRNGMHRYNNQDHSMLSAMAAVENIINRTSSKDPIWAVNAEEAYHESK